MSKKEGLKQKKLYNEVVGLMTRPSDYQSFIDSYRNRPNYYRTAKYKLEIQDTKRKSIAFRNNINFLKIDLEINREESLINFIKSKIND